MGYRFAQELVENGDLSLRSALAYHLQGNHYPPVPLIMIEPCIAALNAALEDEWNAEIQLPEGVLFRGLSTAPAREIIDQHHLYAWL